MRLSLVLLALLSSACAFSRCETILLVSPTLVILPTAPACPPLPSLPLRRL